MPWISLLLDVGLVLGAGRPLVHHGVRRVVRRWARRRSRRRSRTCGGDGVGDAWWRRRPEPLSSASVSSVSSSASSSPRRRPIHVGPNCPRRHAVSSPAPSAPFCSPRPRPRPRRPRRRRRLAGRSACRRRRRRVASLSPSKSSSSSSESAGSLGRGQVVVAQPAAARRKAACIRGGRRTWFPASSATRVHPPRRPRSHRSRLGSVVETSRARWPAGRALEPRRAVHGGVRAADPAVEFSQRVEHLLAGRPQRPRQGMNS